ncbi:MAG: hypothetical protein IJN38_09810, partial [Clostridia bacterium]|nr:hypothetical protein [Clostridia bacterium]
MSVSAATSVDIVFNSMDTSARQDMEPATNTTVKDLSTYTNDYLEGSGAVKYGYKADFNDVYFYGRVPAAYDTTGISIAGATHMIFDLYVSDTTKWTITQNNSFTLRSLKSAQSTGQWDNSCGQIDSANIYSVFSGLRNGWNHVVLPINTSVATETVIWGFRFAIGGGAPKAGFYVLMDDIRFVNQTYLDSAQYATRNLDKMVTRVKAIMAAVPSITSAAEQRRMRVAANITYHSLDATRKNQATGGVVPYDGLDWTDNGVPASYLATRKTVNKGDYAFSLAVLSDLHYAVRNNAAWQDVYLNSMNWIVNNAEKENTLMAIQLGDMTSNVDYNDGRNETCEWDAVRSGFDILRKANIPFATTVG